MSKIFRGLLLNKYIDRRLLEEEEKSKKTRIFIFKVIFKYLEENNEISLRSRGTRFTLVPVRSARTFHPRSPLHKTFLQCLPFVKFYNILSNEI